MRNSLCHSRLHRQRRRRLPDNRPPGKALGQAARSPPSLKSQSSFKALPRLWHGSDPAIAQLLHELFQSSVKALYKLLHRLCRGSPPTALKPPSSQGKETGLRGREKTEESPSVPFSTDTAQPRHVSPIHAVHKRQQLARPFQLEIGVRARNSSTTSPFSSGSRLQVL